jgi:hypothetical protein
MEHILTQCTATPTGTIWNLAQNTWPHNPNLWLEISIGIIMGCGSITPPKTPPEEANQTQNNVPKGATRLLQILISKSAHLIWVLRCERVIQDRTQNRAHTTNEIHQRWLRSINARLTEDRITATRIKRDKQSFQKIRNTWEYVLKKQEDLPQDWITSHEVLVGRRVRHIP